MRLIKIRLFIFIFFSINHFASGQSDSITVGTSSLSDSLKSKEHIIIPRRATYKSLIFPGLGQIYNRQYWKLPLVYGGFGTIFGIIHYNNVRYKKYRSYYYILVPHPEDPTYVPPSTTSVPYEDGTIRDLDVNQLKRINDGYRRNRDLSIISLALVWGLNIIDANVSAHLKTFDVNDQISLEWKPDFNINLNNFEYLAGISLKMKFKK